MSRAISSIALVIGCMSVCTIALFLAGPQVVADDELVGIVGGKEDCDVAPIQGVYTHQGPTCSVKAGATACTSRRYVCNGSIAGANDKLCQPNQGGVSNACQANGNCNADKHDSVSGDCDAT